MIKTSGWMVPDMVKFFVVAFVDSTGFECFTTGSITSFSPLNLRRSLFICSFLRVIPASCAGCLSHYYWSLVLDDPFLVYMVIGQISSLMLCQSKSIAMTSSLGLSTFSVCRRGSKPSLTLFKLIDDFTEDDSFSFLFFCKNFSPRGMINPFDFVI